MEPYFLGNAQVRIESMSFEPGIRDFDNANVARLLKIFRLEGCHRSDPSHFIPALVTKDILGPGWQQGLQPQLLSLPVSVNLRCLHGKHRILAAKQYFPYIEQWWNVALYESVLPNVLYTQLIQQYRNEVTFSDGDIFRYYRYAQIANDEPSMRRWEARLSSSKLRNLLQIEKAHHGRIIRALDALLPFHGLWQAFHLGAWNRILPMHTWQEILMYLARLLQIWLHILDGLPAASISPQTVTALQLRIPALSCADERHIISAMEQTTGSSTGGTQFYIFPNIESTHREAMKGRIRTCDRILSFHSFFEDTVYLEACHHSMRCLLNGGVTAYHKSFESAFRNNFNGSDDAFPERYLQLWLYAMRHFPELSDQAASSPRKDKGTPRPPRANARGDRRQAFISFASSLGFRCFPDLNSKPGETLPDVPLALNNPCTSTDFVDVPIRARCNRPFERSFYIDRKYLFPEQLSEAADKRHEYTTTFAVARDLVRSFWGQKNGAYLHTTDSPRPASALTSPYSAAPIDMSPSEYSRDIDMQEETVSDVSGRELQLINTYQQTDESSPIEIPQTVAVTTPIQYSTSMTRISHAVVHNSMPGNSLKRGERSMEEVEPRIVVTRAGQAAIAMTAIAQNPRGWCVVDEQGMCHVGHDNKTLESVLQTALGPDRTLHLFGESQWRVLLPRAALIESRRPGAIFIITRKGSLHGNELVRQGSSRRTTQPWRKISVNSSHGQQYIVTIEATGDEHRRLVLRDHQEAEIGAVELGGAGVTDSEQESSFLGRTYLVHTYNNDRVKVIIQGLTFECEGEQWKKLISEYDEQMVGWSVERTFEEL